MAGDDGWDDNGVAGALDALPDRSALAAADRVYAIGRPDVLRSLEERAAA